MNSKVIIFSSKDLQTPRALTAEALDAYTYALNNAGIETDEQFIAKRNAKAIGFSELWEFKSWCEKVAECIKEVCKHSFNIGTSEDLPQNVSWSKQTFSRSFDEPLEAIKRVAENENTPVEEIIDKLLLNTTPKQLENAAGIKEERLDAIAGDLITKKEKERVLKIK